MMRRATVLVGLVIGLVLGAPMARAVEPTAPPAPSKELDFTHTGWFVGGGFGGAIATGDFEPGGNGLGTEVRGGYRFHPHIAVEGQLSWFRNVGGNIFNGDIDRRVLSFTGNVKKFFPIGDGRWQPYLLAGIGVTRAKSEVDFLGETISDNTETAFTFRGGGGVEFFINPRVSLYTEGAYMLLTGGLHGAGFVPIVFGAQVHF